MIDNIMSVLQSLQTRSIITSRPQRPVQQDDLFQVVYPYRQKLPHIRKEPENRPYYVVLDTSSSIFAPIFKESRRQHQCLLCRGYTIGRWRCIPELFCTTSDLSHHIAQFETASNAVVMQDNDDCAEFENFSDLPAENLSNNLDTQKYRTLHLK